ncbi:MAG TPA: type II toxin-antitoxin system HicB family antitoxin [Longimicrobium sp.]|nr:type II toxin-antitoxin system HicB family antitoxin [Longimicrobium sp.]
MQLHFTAIYHKAEEGGYVAWLEELPGAVTQGETLDEAREMLRDATMLPLDARRVLAAEETAGLDVIREPLVIDRA